MSLLPGRMAPIPVGRLRGGILSASNALPASFDEWRQGVQFWSNCQESVGLTQCVNPSTAPIKEFTNQADGRLTFAPFLTYAGRDCSTWVDEAELRQRAREGFDAQLSQAFALQLQTDAAGLGDGNDLNSTAVDITPAIPSGLDNTLSGLIDALQCGCFVNDVTIHAPLRLKPFFQSAYLVEWDEAASLYRMGDIKFSFDCYSDTGPDDIDANPDGSEAWLYATGPVETALGSEEVFSGLMAPTNERSVFVERLAILRYDTCCVRAALARVC